MVARDEGKSLWSAAEFALNNGVLAAEAARNSVDLSI